MYIEMLLCAYIIVSELYQYPNFLGSPIQSVSYVQLNLCPCLRNLVGGVLEFFLVETFSNIFQEGNVHKKYIKEQKLICNE